MKIVFTGDSLVSCTNVKLQETWPAIAASKRGFQAVNAAAGGRLTILMRGMFKNDVLAEHPDGVFILCGINDVLLDEPFDKIRENISVTLDQAGEAGIPLVILGKPVLPRLESTECGWQLPSEFKKHDEELKKYRSWLDEEAQRRNLPVLDLESIISEAEARTGEKMLSDGIHPRAAGYAAIADAFVALLDQLQQGSSL
jgi:acyl-CoA thioesterase-1